MSSRSIERRSPVAVWSDRAILGHGVVALLARGPQPWHVTWFGDGSDGMPVAADLSGACVLVAIWDGSRTWALVRAQLAGWLDVGIGVVLVGRAGSAEDVSAAARLPRVRWCAPDTSAQSLAAAVAEVATVAAGPWSQPCRPARPSLSEQEQRVLAMVSSGLKVAAVGRRLQVSPHTVHTYLRRIRRKFAEAGTPVSSPLELYRAAELWGLVDEPVVASIRPPSAGLALESSA